jgi:hypothetical protein
MMRSVLVLPLLIAGMLLFGGAPARAGDPPPDCASTELAHGIEIGCHQDGSSSGGQSNGNGGTGVSAPVTEWTETRYIPTCSVNEVEGGADALCMGAVASCPEKPAIRFWVYVRTVYADKDRAPTQWEMTGTECRGPDEPTETVPKVTRQDVIDAVKALAPKATFAVQPATQTYVNVPNNYYASAPDLNVPVTVFGLPIAVRFSNASVVWDFGDGSQAQGTGIKDAAVGQAGAIEHAYAENGTYQVRVATSFHVAFDLPGGAHVEDDVQGFPSASVALQVGEIQTLVTDAR